jgi:hypothetical protein
MLAAASVYAGSAASEISLHRGVESADVDVGFALASACALADAPLHAVANAIAARSGRANGLSLDRVELVFRAPGASPANSPAFPAFHYVVDTDPAEGWQDEMFRWHDEAHMPGLAATPGCVLTRRYLNHDHGPYSLACYELVAADVVVSPAWRAVRGSAGSSRVRPQFRDTLRTMFRSVRRIAP